MAYDTQDFANDSLDLNSDFESVVAKARWLAERFHTYETEINALPLPSSPWGTTGMTKADVLASAVMINQFLLFIDNGEPAQQNYAAVIAQLANIQRS